MHTFEQFQRDCAHYGFISTPITRHEFGAVLGAGLNSADAYNIACDVNTGFRFIDCLRDNVRAMRENR